MNSALLSYLTLRSSYPDATQEIRHVETHISHVFLTGPHAYKIKKPLNLGFLDFSSLEKRKYYCEREVQLNRRFAPDLYLGTVPIRLQGDRFSLEGEGLIVEYAVKMLQFDNSTLFSELVCRNALSPDLVIEVTREIAGFHKRADKTPEYWGVASVRRVIDESLEVLEKHAADIIASDDAGRLRQAFHESLGRSAALIEDRQHTSVRALHGDLHLRNICLYMGKPQLFDGIEFNNELACCDVWADIAFLIMDLRYQNRSDLAAIVTNTYLESTDDYEGLALLRLYAAYRAAVRAKVSCIERRTSCEEGQKRHAVESVRRHVELAFSNLKQEPVVIIAVGGLSGSGKSTLSRELALQLDGIHIRSDVIRKHLLGLDPLSPAPATAYSTSSKAAVYEAMQRRAELALAHGGPIILDAVHGSDEQRAGVKRFVSRRGLPFLGINCVVDLETALKRVRNRKSDASDADAHIVEEQSRAISHDFEWVQVNTNRPPSEVAAELVHQVALLRDRSL